MGTGYVDAHLTASAVLRMLSCGHLIRNWRKWPAACMYNIQIDNQSLHQIGLHARLPAIDTRREKQS